MVAKVRKSKKVVTVALVRDAVAALSERNGSSVKSVLNYLVWKRQVNSGARKQVVLAIRKAVKAGVLVKKSGKGFVVSGNKLASKPATKGGKRKARRARKRTTKKSSKKSTRARRRRGGPKKRKARKSSKVQKVRKLSKKVQTSSTSVARKPVKSGKRKVNRKPKSANNAKSAPKMSARPRRMCTTAVRYTK
ncbi:---NA--- [Paramuricea clavata]|uniref:---NA n=1 Tax=Paramuricea clavata TaxID=317549 RepID=A0A7D9EVY3_PARCT|nr:---NA--- [Paramuricea clavata]